MPQKKPEKNSEGLYDLLQKLIVIQLGKEGVPHNEIARIAGLHVTKVSPIVKLINKNKNGRKITK